MFDNFDTEIQCEEVYTEEPKIDSVIEKPKRKPYVCPRCGHYGQVIMDDMVTDDVECAEMFCSYCGSTWNEFFTLIWNGYDYNGNSYNLSCEV